MAQYNRRLTKQPQGAVGIDWDNPVATDLVSFHHPPSNRLITRSGNVTLRKVGSFGGNQLDFPTPYGLSYTIPTTFEEVVETSDLGDGSVTQLTYIGQFWIPRVDQSFSRKSLIANGTVDANVNFPNTGTRVACVLSGDGTKLTVEVVIAGGFGGTVASSEITEPGLYTIGISGTSGGSTNLYINGVFSGTANCGTFIRHKLRVFEYNGSGDTPVSLNDTAYRLGLASWKRAMTHEEHSCFDFWQLFSKQQNVFFGPELPAPVTSRIKHKPSSGSFSRTNLSINTKDPITDGLLVAMDADSNFDYVNNKVLTPRDNYSGVTKSITKFGRAANTGFIGNQGGLRTGNWSYIQNQARSGAVTLVYVGGLHSGLNTISATLIPASSGALEIAIGTRSLGTRLYGAYESSYGAGGVEFAVNTEQAFCSVFALAVSPFAAPKLYVDGVHVASGASAGGVVNRGIAGAAFCGGRYVASSNSKLILGWNRQLTDEEIKRVSEDPWCMFEKPVRYVSTISSATLIPSIFALVPTNITGSSLRPRYQLTF